MSRYISGEEILEAFNLKSIELFTAVVTSGLQPLDQSGTPIPPPDVSWRSKENSPTRGTD